MNINYYIFFLFVYCQITEITHVTHDNNFYFINKARQSVKLY